MALQARTGAGPDFVNFYSVAHDYWTSVAIIVELHTSPEMQIGQISRSKADQIPLDQDMPCLLNIRFTTLSQSHSSLAEVSAGERRNNDPIPDRGAGVALGKKTSSFRVVRPPSRDSS